MALSDCIRCWNTPCTCGWDYRNSSVEHLIKMRDLFDKVIKYKETNPNTTFTTSYSGGLSEDDKKFVKYMEEA